MATNETRYYIGVDGENGDEDWWDAARNHDTIPPPLRDWLLKMHDGGDFLIVSEEDGRAIEEWAATLPGWGEGPEFARKVVRPAPLGVNDLCPRCIAAMADEVSRAQRRAVTV